ncbi:glycerophosphoryl diester phosphodiesterase [Sinimarinibacterium flocculans]|uniref:Glycerophosphoryl diester phosphodiesterase n=1 Tax=Sinimarinibacterium flocculans TaxID=985250 RepID=A0A318EF80_9GAMM|nr:glycerophosphodiester phosphodiesterase family protein [Sinimarinibacterium flocculans]PXV69435.1 glycerophosphoryl diester phosphodiesterase [Sinimarinibacterium flocculans]
MNIAVRTLLVALVLPLTACLGDSEAPVSAPGSATPGAEASAAPLDQAHAHNDYEHPRPLADALDHGFMSVEADVWFLGGSELYVAHDAIDIRAARTLRTLYLDPLMARFERYGAIHPQQTRPFQLLVDIKTEAQTTWAALEATLADYAPMLSVYDHGAVVPGAVEIVLSGNRPTATLAQTDHRLAFIDGRLSDLDDPPPPTLVPLISDNWTTHFGWDGNGAMPADESAKLDAITAQAAAAGYRLRFWATPDAPGTAREAVWQRLYNAGVDHLNTNDLAGLSAFLRRQRGDVADAARTRLRHPDEACAQTPEPAHWRDAGTPDAGATPPFVSAHRGAQYLAPENTLWAYRHAFAYGADTVEVDVRTSLDGVLFSLHDDTVDRTTDGEGAAATKTWAELSRLDAADFAPWAGGPYAGTRIPRLEEVLELAASVGGGVELDMKFVLDYPRLVRLVEQYGLTERSYYAASGIGATGLRALDPDIRFIHNLSGSETPEDLHAQTAQSTVFGSRLDRFTAGNIAAIHDGCMLVVPHTYDEGPEVEAAQWELGRALGIDGAQTDQPDVIRARQAAVDPRRRLPTQLVRGDGDTRVCLVNAFNRLGLPFLGLRWNGGEARTGIDGCVDLPDDPAVLQPRFDGSGALFPTRWSGA